MNTIDIPSDFQYPEVIEQTVDMYNGTDTLQLLDDVVQRTHENGTRMIMATPETHGDFADAVADKLVIITFDYPFANGAFPWKSIEAQFIADITGYPVIGLAAPGTDGSRYTFSDTEKRTIAGGDMTPYVHKGNQAIAEHTEVPRIAATGASQGANMATARGLTAGGYFEGADFVSVFDHTGAKKRMRTQLLSDMGKAGYDKLEEELRDGDVDALLETLGFSGDQATSELQKMLHYFASIRKDLRNSLLIPKGLGKLTLARDMADLNEAGIRSVFGYGAQSAIAGGEAMDEASMTAKSLMIDRSFNTNPLPQVIRFEDTTHAGGDNMKKFGLLVLVGAGMAEL